MTQNVMVTGGGGFLGRYVVEQLQRLGSPVAMMTRAVPQVAPPDVQCFVGDIRDAQFVKNAMRDITVVFHVAGNIRTPSSDLPELHRAVNLGGTQNVLRACRDCGVQRLVFVSTCEVYGNDAGEQVREEHPKAPGNSYAESKWQAEQACLEFTLTGHCRVTVVRPSYIFGHGQFQGRLFPRLVRSICEPPAGDGPPPLQPGQGGNDFVYVRDVARGVVFLGTRSQEHPVETFNLGSGVFTPVRTVFEVLREIAGLEFLEHEKVETASPKFSLSMARAAVAGFVPRYSIRDALVDYLATARADYQR